MTNRLIPLTLRDDLHPSCPVPVAQDALSILRHSKPTTATCMEMALQESLLQPSGASLIADEPWTVSNEELLKSWGARWRSLQLQHEAAEAYKRKGAFLLQLPTIIIPLMLTPLLAKGIIQEDSPLSLLLLISSSACSGIQTLLDWGRISERHAQTANKLRDLVTDLEELLAKQPLYRPRCDVTMQRFKMLMVTTERNAPYIGGFSLCRSTRQVPDVEESSSGSDV